MAVMAKFHGKPLYGEAALKGATRRASSHPSKRVPDLVSALWQRSRSHSSSRDYS